MPSGKHGLPQGTALPTLAGRERHQKCGRAGRFIKAVLLAAGKLAATLRQARGQVKPERAAFPVSNSPLIYSANAGRQYYSIQPIFLPLALLR